MRQSLPLGHSPLPGYIDTHEADLPPHRGNPRAQGRVRTTDGHAVPADDHARYAQTRANEQRRRIAVEAARLIAEGGLRDYRQAKLKAAARLGIADDLSLPKNGEIEDALREHQRLFRAEQPQHAARLREVGARSHALLRALSSRDWSAPCSKAPPTSIPPCACTCTTTSPSDIALFLREHGIPYEERTRRLRLERDVAADVPVFLFAADDSAIDLTVLPYDRLRQAPLDRIDEKPMRARDRRRVGSSSRDEAVR